VNESNAESRQRTKAMEKEIARLKAQRSMKRQRKQRSKGQEEPHKDNPDKKDPDEGPNTGKENDQTTEPSVSTHTTPDPQQTSNRNTAPERAHPPKGSRRFHMTLPSPMDYTPLPRIYAEFQEATHLYRHYPNWDLLSPKELYLLTSTNEWEWTPESVYQITQRK
jgi:hypothetical protein